MSVEQVAELLSNLKVSSPSEAVVAAVKKDISILESLCNELAAKASLTGKGDINTAKHALICFTALAEECITVAEPFLIKHLPTILTACGHKSANVIRDSASNALKKLTQKMSANSVNEILPAIYAASEQSCNWQTRVAAFETIKHLADHAPEQLCHSLPDTIPVVSACVVDLKPQVSESAEAALTSACDVIGNRDIEHMTSHIVRSVVHPQEVPELMHKLAGVTFVQSVQSAALAMVTPLLIRGLNSGRKETVRQSAVIIDNMSRLVDDPIDAAPFLCLLLPALQKASEIISDPEARSVAERALAQLGRLNKEVEEAKSRVQIADHQKVLSLVSDLFPSLSNDVVKSHLACRCMSLMGLRKFKAGEWAEEFSSVLNMFNPSSSNSEQIEKLRVGCDAMVKPLPGKNDDIDDPASLLCDCQFTLAYGTKILLHNTTMRLKRGAKYGLLGGNDSGKTTLMRSIANGSVEGFPDPASVRTVFVEADILGELSHLSCVDYIMQDERLQGLDKGEVLTVMASVGFTDDGKAKPHHPVSSLSGGWRMKLAMARAMLQRADILLLDEPTNHLDVINVKWVKNYINSLTHVTAIMVSHDSGFLNDCCTNIIQIDRLKLKQFRGNLNTFIEQNPEAKAYFSIKSSKLKFSFPQPGPIEGIKSRSKALMKMSHCDFTYPGNTKPTLFDITIQVSMASRVGVVGENGAGKSTMIKVLTGEVVPQTGDVWVHPNARIAYVAQHAFHHIESHLDKTPNEYIRWRYANGEDKESLVKISMVFTPEEEKLQSTPFEFQWKDENGVNKKAKKIISDVLNSRRENKTSRELEYECHFVGDSPDSEGTFVPVSVLKKQGWEKSVKAVDQRIAQRSGMYVRTLSASNVEQHLGDVGLEAEFATHYRMSALSGGQKVKVVMAAALWNQPHILILDEPTNYLDRESLGALAGAIEEFKGGVVIISHNQEFVSTLCSEEWLMDAGHLATKGVVGWMNQQDDKISDQNQIAEMTDAVGNVVKLKQSKKLSKREEKALIKKIKSKLDNGIELEDEEMEFALEQGIL
jgi:elongation factor 3